MPGSPSTGRSHSNTTTRRSSVSNAVKEFSSKSPSGSSKPETSGGISKALSVPTVGTIVNPNLTASELFAKSPSVQTDETNRNSTATGLKPESSQSDGPRSSASTKPSHSAPSNDKTSSLLAGSSATKLSKGQTSIAISNLFSANKNSKRVQSGATSKFPGTRMSSSGRQPTQLISETQQVSALASQPNDPNADSAAIPLEASLSNVGRGLVDVTTRSGAVIQIIFSLTSTLIFAYLYIYLLSYARCFRDLKWEAFMMYSSLSGAVVSLLVLFHSAFERRASTRGVFGCVIFFILAVIIFVNILISFTAMNCICRCPPGSSAWSLGQREDLTIFALAFGGSFCLIIFLLVASVAHQ